MTKRQRIDASREVRLWTSMLLGAGTAIVCARPDLVEKAKAAVKGVKNKAVKTFNDLKSKFSNKPEEGAN